MHYIYKVSNDVNDKLYIGQTVNLEKRKLAHFYDNRTTNQIFKKAILKYGKEHFNFEIIDTATSKKEANEKEIYYIRYYNSIKPNGYNMTIGGEGAAISWNSVGVCCFDLNGNFIKEYPSAQSAANELHLTSGDILRTARGKNKRVGIYQFCKSEDKNKFIGKKYERPLSNRKKKIYQFSRYGEYLNEFDSEQEASIKTGTHRTNIAQSLDKNSLANNFLWRTTDNNKQNIEPYFKDCGKHILQFDENMNLINEYVNCIQATYFLKLPMKAYKVINKYLDTSTKAYNFYWKRK